MNACIRLFAIIFFALTMCLEYKIMGAETPFHEPVKDYDPSEFSPKIRAIRRIKKDERIKKKNTIDCEYEDYENRKADKQKMATVAYKQKIKNIIDDDQSSL